MAITVWLPIVVSVAALGLSIWNFWTNQIRRGEVRMTQPTFIFLGRDLPDNRPKIFLRTLLYSTSVRGHVIESMYLRVSQNPLGQADGEIAHIFDFWGYAEREKIMLGSGLYVGQAGVAFNHHFNLSRKAGPQFCWWSAPCRIQVFARVVGDAAAQLLQEVTIDINGEHAALLVQVMDVGVRYEWAADSGEYVAYADRRSDREPLPVTMLRG